MRQTSQSAASPLTALATRIRQLSAYWTTEHSGMVPMPIDKVSNFPTFGWVRQRDVLAIADELDALAAEKKGDAQGVVLPESTMPEGGQVRAAVPGDATPMPVQAAEATRRYDGHSLGCVRHAEQIVQALTAAGFDVRAASPLQHHAECGFWRDRPCDCAIQQLQEAIDDRDTR